MGSHKEFHESINTKQLSSRPTGSNEQQEWRNTSLLEPYFWKILEFLSAQRTLACSFERETSIRGERAPNTLLGKQQWRLEGMKGFSQRTATNEQKKNKSIIGSSLSLQRTHKLGEEPYSEGSYEFNSKCSITQRKRSTGKPSAFLEKKLAKSNQHIGNWGLYDAKPARGVSSPVRKWGERDEREVRPRRDILLCLLFGSKYVERTHKLQANFQDMISSP